MKDMKLSQFDFDLPQDRIARNLMPLKEDGRVQWRDECRLLVLHKKTGEIEHKIFKDVVDYFGKGDRFVFNDTKVFSKRALTKLTPKIHKVVPGESLIGLLLNQVTSYRVISANEKASFFQHSIFKWDLDEETGELIELERNSNASKTKQTMFQNWLASLSREDLVQMTECLFDILQAKDRKTIYEVMALGKLDLGITLIKSWMKYDEETKKKLKKNLFSAFTFYKEAKEEIAASYGPKKEKKPKKNVFSIFKKKKTEK